MKRGSQRWRLVLLRTMVCGLWTISMGWMSAAADAAIRRVPSEYATIAQAISAASAGDTILVAPGTYSESVSLNKLVILEGEGYLTVVTDLANNPAKINGTITVSGLSGAAWNAGAVIRGFKITGADPVISKSPVIVEYCYVKATNGDGVSFEPGGAGIVRFNLLEGADDDNIDVDHQTKPIWIERNILLDSGQDGIEIRQHNDTIPSLVRLTFTGNWVENSGGDGMQIMDYNNDSNREYYLERNVFVRTHQAAIGLMPGENTNEDYSAAPMPERLALINNTFVDNHAGVSGGANVVAVNNVFADSDGTDFLFQFKDVQDDSIIAHALVRNASGIEGTVNLHAPSISYGDPLLNGTTLRLQPGSPAIDAGVTTYMHGGQTIFTIPPGQYAGAAPDLGAYEAGGSLRGDVDESGSVTLDDLRHLWHMLTGQMAPVLERADLTGDGKVSLVDVRELIQLLIS